jgi:site-specific DNA recombinase
MSNNVAIYARVSGEEQAAAGTIENQLHACREYCASKGYLVVAEFPDEAVSGTVPFEDRPQGARLLEMAGHGIFDRTVIYCVDRLARDVVEAAVARKALEAIARVDFVTQSFDGTPEGRLMFNQFAAFAEYEREVIARRTKLGRYKSARNGRYMATIPAYGYRRGENGAAVIDEDEAAVVRSIFHDATSEDQGTWAIAERLNTGRVKPPRSAKRREEEKWGPTTIAKILTAERYTGSGTYGPEIVTYPPIIEAETFHAAKAALGRRRTSYLTGKRNGYLLAGFIRCRVCGAVCTGVKTGRNQRPAYHCGGWRRGRRRQDHGRYYWYAEGIEEWVRGELQALLYRPETLQHRVEAWLERELDELHTLKEEQERLRRKLDDLPTQEERVLQTHRNGITNDDQLSRQLAAIAEERESVEARLREIKDDRDRGIDYLTDFKAKRDLLNAVRERGIQHLRSGGIESVMIEFSPACDPLLTPADYQTVMRELGVTVYVEANGGVSIEMGLKLAASSYPLT